MVLQNKNLHYQISDWTQVTKCLSNNSRNLSLSLIRVKAAGTLEGLVIQVNHTELGTLFAAMIDGSGLLITPEDETGCVIPFMTTDEILIQLSKFGFYIEYNQKENLPGPVLDFFQHWMEMGYDRITRVLLQSKDRFGNTIWKDSIVIFKDCVENLDLISYGEKLSRNKYIQKVDANTIQNVTDAGFRWDWVDSVYRLEDIMNENTDIDDDYSSTVNSSIPEIHSDTVDTAVTIDDSELAPSGFTIYEEDTDESE